MQEIALTLLLSLRFMSLVFEEVSNRVNRWKKLRFSHCRVTRP
jgi:hypothetical protein